MTRRKTIRAEYFYHHAKCPHRVYLDMHGDRAERAEVSPFVELLWERGIQHEEEVIEAIRRDRPLETVEAEDLEAAFQKTYALMHRGAELIYQGVLIDGNRIGRPDLLERTAGPSDLGSYHYVPMDIKAARGTAESGDVKKAYAHQVLFYCDLLEAVQGYRPPVGKIINIDHEELQFDAGDYAGTYPVVKAEIETIAMGARQTELVLAGHCKQCHWFQKCWKEAEESDDLTRVFYLGKVKRGFREQGVTTVKELTEIREDEFLGPRKVTGVGKVSLRKFIRRAQVLRSGKPSIRGPLDLPDAGHEVYFDVEDDPTQDLVYLYGFLEGAEYAPILAALPDQDEQAFREFLVHLRGLPEDAVIYHYGNHEVTVFGRLVEKYSVGDEELEWFKEVAQDLYRTVEQSTDWPLTFYGLKEIANYLGFQWSAEDSSGANSIVWYNEYLADPETNKHIIEKIILYNREDCEALRYVKAYLAGQWKLPAG